MSSHNKTIVLPSPGQPRDKAKPIEVPKKSQPLSANSQTSTQHSSPQSVVFQNIEPSPNQTASDLCSLANPFFSTCIHLKSLMHVEDVEKIRSSLQNDIKETLYKLEKTTLSAEKRQSFIFIICAYIDEVILNTPWGHKSSWSQKGMLTTFFKQAWGGQQFFTILEHFMSHPKDNIELIKVMYSCLNLGFQGKMRGAPGGAAKLTSLKDRVFREIQLYDSNKSSQLSPKSIPSQDSQQKTGKLPIWVLASVLAGVLFASFSFLSFKLDNRSDLTYAHLSRLVIKKDTTESAPFIEPIMKSRYERIVSNLSHHIENQNLMVMNKQRGILVRISVGDLFDSGKANVKEKYVHFLQEVTQILEKEGQSLEVYGHTDNQKIRSLRYPSNWHLSQARAVSVRKIIRKTSQNLDIAVKPKGDTSPVLPNTNAQNRAQNRRIELLLLN